MWENTQKWYSESHIPEIGKSHSGVFKLPQHFHNYLYFHNRYLRTKALVALFKFAFLELGRKLRPPASVHMWRISTASTYLHMAIYMYM